MTSQSHTSSRPSSAFNHPTEGRRSGQLLAVVGLGLVSTIASSCALGTPKPDGTFTHPQCQSSAEPVVLDDSERHGAWLAKSIPEAVCGDGSPYKIYVKYEEGSTDVVVTFEPGGACFDERSCLGTRGALSAHRLFNDPGDLNGTSELDILDDKLMTRIDQETAAQFDRFPVGPGFFGLSTPDDNYREAFPMGQSSAHLGEIDYEAPTTGYNQVFLPNCTGDNFAGDLEGRYGSPQFSVQHRGRKNMKLVAEWLEEKFSGSEVGQLLLLGSSAGGIGAQVNYKVFRDAIDPKCSALVNDSGLLFPAGGPQQAMREQLRDTWDLRALYSELDSDLASVAASNNLPKLSDDVSNVNEALPLAYPQDRFLVGGFQADLLFGAFSYAITGEATVAEEIEDLWRSEVDDLRAVLNEHQAQKGQSNNAGYYFPSYRPDFCSHVMAIAPVDKETDEEYIKQALAGGADGYEGTELYDSRFLVSRSDGSTRHFHFGDALRQLLDVDAPIPRYFGRISPDSNSSRQSPSSHSADNRTRCVSTGD